MKNQILLFLFSISTILAYSQTIDLPVDFELTNTAYFTDFGGNISSTGVDPTDPNNTVGVANKPLGSENWAGTSLGTMGFTNAIPFTASATTMSVRVYSPDAGIAVHLKAEDLNDPAINVEARAYTTRANTWETLVFDFSNPIANSPALNISTVYKKLSIFFNFGIDGNTAGDKTYYWDDVAMGGTSTTLNQLDLPVTFEMPTTSYALVDFSGNTSTIGLDPNNGAQHVAITTKPVSAVAWSGTIIGTRNGFVNKIPFTATETTIKARVYSPDANVPILLKAEVASDPAITVETYAYTTVANSWEILEWNFANHVPGGAPLDLNIDYNLLAIFFNFGTDGATAGEKTYYWDNVSLGDLTFTNHINTIESMAFPNPVRDQLQIQVEGEINELTIFNTLGQAVYTEQVSNNKKIFDIAELPTGVYFVQLKIERLGKSLIKIIKE